MNKKVILEKDVLETINEFDEQIVIKSYLKVIQEIVVCWIILTQNSFLIFINNNFFKFNKKV